MSFISQYLFHLCVAYVYFGFILFLYILEPGYYEVGNFGIRIENLVEIISSPSHENFLEFNTISLVNYKNTHAHNITVLSFLLTELTITQQ